MAPSSMEDLFQFLSDLMTQHSDLFLTAGVNMFRGFATILVVWFGIQSALASVSGGTPFRFDRLISLVMTLAFGFTMITFYARPIPGIGVSFCHLIVDQGLALSNELNHSLVDEVWQRLNSLYWSLEAPGLSVVLNVMEIIRYSLVSMAIIVAEAMMFAVIAFGYIASAITVMLGPIFISFFIVPRMEWLFWGWLKAFIQYAFYPVIGNAYVFVFGNVLIHFIDAHPAPYDGATIFLLFGPLLLLLIAFAYGLLKIPSLVNSIFTGRSGEAAWPRF